MGSEAMTDKRERTELERVIHDNLHYSPDGIEKLFADHNATVAAEQKAVYLKTAGDAVIECCERLALNTLDAATYVHAICDAFTKAERTETPR